LITDKNEEIESRFRKRAAAPVITDSGKRTFKRQLPEGIC